LLVVIGIIALLIGILMPALNKARKAARQTACLSNLRSMGQAYTIYLSQNKGHLPYYIWRTNPINAETSWHGYWIGMLSDLGVQSGKLLCPEATDAVPYNINGSKGFGTAFNAWSGEFQSTATGVKIDSKKFVNDTNDATQGGYRIGSYGFNRHTTANKSSSTYFGMYVTSLKPSTDVPVFFDSTWVDIDIDNFGSGGSATNPVPVQNPPDLSGSAAAGNSNVDHWRFLMTRHNRGVNFCFADGSAKWVPLEETYQLKWSPQWTRYSLTNLPQK